LSVESITFKPVSQSDLPRFETFVHNCSCIFEPVGRIFKMRL